MCTHGEQDPERSKDPVDYVSRLLEERDKYERIVVTAFGEDKTFRNALNQVINLQTVCLAHLCACSKTVRYQAVASILVQWLGLFLLQRTCPLVY